MAASSDSDIARLVKRLSQENNHELRQRARDMRDHMDYNKLYRFSWLAYAKEEDDPDIKEMLLAACRSLGEFCGSASKR
jgi:hypothetical protein